MTHSDGKILFLFQEGTIGHDLVVKPVPSHVRKHILDPADIEAERHRLPDNVTLGAKDFVHHQHIVYRRNSADSTDLSDFGKNPENSDQKL